MNRHEADHLPVVRDVDPSTVTKGCVALNIEIFEVRQLRDVQPTLEPNPVFVSTGLQRGVRAACRNGHLKKVSGSLGDTNCYSFRYVSDFAD